MSGAATASGDFKFQVEVADATSSAAFASYDIYVNPPALTILTTSLSTGNVGAAYSASLTASGGNPPYAWTTTAASLPPGLTLSSGGILSGTPTVSGTYQFQVELADSHSVAAFQTYTVTIGAPVISTTTAVSITTTTLPGGTVSQAYSASLAATGGTAPYAWSVSAGVLPAGLTLSSAGVLSGTPTTAAQSSFTILATDSLSATGSASILCLTIAAAASGPANPDALAIIYPGLDPTTTGVAYSRQLYGTGGVTPYAWSLVSGSLPPGITLDPVFGSLSGVGTQSGDYNFVVKLTDATSTSVTQAYELYVGGTGGSGGTGTGTGGTSAPVSVTVVNGTLNGGTASTGSFASGTSVTITANAAPSGETFNAWTGASVASPNAPSTTLIVGASSETVTATYYVPAPIPQRRSRVTHVFGLRLRICRSFRAGPHRRTRSTNRDCFRC